MSNHVELLAEVDRRSTAGLVDLLLDRLQDREERGTWPMIISSGSSGQILRWNGDSSVWASPPPCEQTEMSPVYYTPETLDRVVLMHHDAIVFAKRVEAVGMDRCIKRYVDCNTFEPCVAIRDPDKLTDAQRAMLSHILNRIQEEKLYD